MKDKLTVFISYSKKDIKWLNQMKRHFKLLKNEVEFWDDSAISPGQVWRLEIEKALRKAQIAILLISTDFFNSDFIETNELPTLLDTAEQGGTKILSVIVKPCLFNEYQRISKFQAINSPSNSLITMNEAEREEVFIKLVMQIKSIART